VAIPGKQLDSLIDPREHPVAVVLDLEDIALCVGGHVAQNGELGIETGREGRPHSGLWKANRRLSHHLCAALGGGLELSIYLPSDRWRSETFSPRRLFPPSEVELPYDAHSRDPRAHAGGGFADMSRNSQLA
jgi:hypothetical protein